MVFWNASGIYEKWYVKYARTFSNPNTIGPLKKQQQSNFKSRFNICYTVLFNECLLLGHLCVHVSRTLSNVKIKTEMHKKKKARCSQC